MGGALIQLAITQLVLRLVSVVAYAALWRVPSSGQMKRREFVR